ncbi:unnamed protein product [Allacma fusca]|uniref:Uncharacterized protein n=2 Tax=Allacma fusca TaxID=39272 RepID=A0A8J2KL46_9HEXA|nr:unnamed protein product [Allacma fusca]
MYIFHMTRTPKQAVSQFENWTRWHRIEPNKVRYYDLTLHPMSMKTSFRHAEAVFWYETLPQVREMALEMDQLQPYSYFFWILVAALALLLLIIISILAYCCCIR